jgi:hypothetical protein
MKENLRLSETSWAFAKLRISINFNTISYRPAPAAHRSPSDQSRSAWDHRGPAVQAAPAGPAGRPPPPRRARRAGRQCRGGRTCPAPPSPPSCPWGRGCPLCPVCPVGPRLPVRLSRPGCRNFRRLPGKKEWRKKNIFFKGKIDCSLKQRESYIAAVTSYLQSLCLEYVCVCVCG